MTRPLTLLALWTTLTLTVGCTDSATSNTPEQSDDSRADLAWDPAKWGPFSVGYRSFQHSYAPTSGGIPPRQLTINLWYPTEASSGEEPQYFNAWSASFFYAFADERVIKDAPAAAPADGQRYPVLVVSHGANGFGASTASINHYFASHGWVVAAPDHTADTLSDVGKQAPLWLRLARPLDISATLDSLDQLAAGTLAAKPATDKVAMAGHSRGAVTTWAASGARFDRDKIKAKCEQSNDPLCTAPVLDGYDAGARDERVACGIPMAGGGGFDPWFGDSGHSKAAVPQMQMSGSLDKDNPQEVWDVAGSVPLTWVHLEGACHQAFAMGNCPKLENKQGFPLIDAYALAFARHHVLGDKTATTMALLDGSKTLSSLVTVKRKNVSP